MGEHLNILGALPANKGEGCWKDYKWVPILTVRLIVEALTIHCHCKSQCIFRRTKKLTLAVGSVTNWIIAFSV